MEAHLETCIINASHVNLHNYNYLLDTSSPTNKCLTSTDPDTCTECYEGFSKKIDTSATPDEKCYRNIYHSDSFSLQ